MTVAFSPAKKYRLLVAFDAQIIVGDTLVPVARYTYGVVSETRRYAMLRRLACIVKCACGCDTWAPRGHIEFDHEHNWASGGRSALSNGRPLRRSPCHVAKSAVEQKVTGKVTRVRRKLSVTTGIRENDSRSPARHSRQSWPKRSLSNPKWKKCFGGRVERRAP